MGCWETQWIEESVWKIMVCRASTLRVQGASACATDVLPLPKFTAVRTTSVGSLIAPASASERAPMFTVTVVPSARVQLIDHRTEVKGHHSQ